MYDGLIPSRQKTLSSPKHPD